MPKLTGSKKASQFTESVIREMTRLHEMYGGVNLSQGFPDFPAPAAIKEAACQAIRADINQYAVTWGARAFREAIAADFAAEQQATVRLINASALGTGAITISGSGALELANVSNGQVIGFSGEGTLRGTGTAASDQHADLGFREFDEQPSGAIEDDRRRCGVGGQHQGCGLGDHPLHTRDRLLSLEELDEVGDIDAERRLSVGHGSSVRSALRASQHVAKPDRRGYVLVESERTKPRAYRALFGE